MKQPVKAVVLAAGKGTRLQTEGITLPKVMRSAAGKPLLHYVLSALSFLPREDVILVVGYHKEDVLNAYPDYPHAEQIEQKGTGHAVASAAALLEDFEGDVLVCCGDMPLMKRESYEALVRRHQEAGNVCTLLSACRRRSCPTAGCCAPPDGAFSRIVEDKDATPEEKAVRELNAGVYVFRCKELLNALTHCAATTPRGSTISPTCPPC